MGVAGPGVKCDARWNSGGRGCGKPVCFPQTIQPLSSPSRALRADDSERFPGDAQAESASAGRASDACLFGDIHVQLEALAGLQVAAGGQVIPLAQLAYRDPETVRDARQ